jgi:nicotinamidase-related amidase
VEKVFPRREGKTFIASSGTAVVRSIEGVSDWAAKDTAIIICDMWSDHPCKSAAARVAAMAPRMATAVAAARDAGVAIIHAPSAEPGMTEV